MKDLPALAAAFGFILACGGLGMFVVWLLEKRSLRSHDKALPLTKAKRPKDMRYF